MDGATIRRLALLVSSALLALATSYFLMNDVRVTESYVRTILY